MFSFRSVIGESVVKFVFRQGIAFRAEPINLAFMRTFILIFVTLFLVSACSGMPSTIVPDLFEVPRAPFMPRDDYPIPPNVERMMGPDDCRGATLIAVEAEIPDYPMRAWDRGRQGWVVVKFHVYSDGSVHRSSVLRSVPGGSFNRASTQAVAKWRFQPLEGVESLSNCVVLFEFRAGEVRIR